MSKITNEGLTRSGTGCFIAVLTWQQWASKGCDDAMIYAEVQSTDVMCVCALLLCRLV